MTTTAIGQAAEVAVADFLSTKGYKILDRNWKNRWCEIDIVARKDKVIYFVEVKYRTRRGQGGGLEHITPTKLKQMTFAAKFWAASRSWSGDFRLMAASVSSDGAAYSVDEVIEV